MITKKMYLIHDFLYKAIRDIPTESFDGKSKLKEVYVRLPLELANEKEIDTTIERVEILSNDWEE